jgi:hypothetical protein
MPTFGEYGQLVTITLQILQTLSTVETVVDVLTSTASKIFAGCYAVFSGLVLVRATVLVPGPILHRVLHRLHLNDLDDFEEESSART